MYAISLSNIELVKVKSILSFMPPAEKDVYINQFVSRYGRFDGLHVKYATHPFCQGHNKINKQPGIVICILFYKLEVFQLIFLNMI